MILCETSQFSTTKDPQRKKKIYKLECEELCSRRLRFAFWSQSILQVASSCVNLSVLIPRSPFTIGRRFVFAASHTAAWVRRCVRSGCSLRIPKTAETPLKSASVFQLSSCLQDSAFLIFLFICFELFFSEFYCSIRVSVPVFRSLDRCYYNTMRSLISKVFSKDLYYEIHLILCEFNLSWSTVCGERERGNETPVIELCVF